MSAFDGRLQKTFFTLTDVLIYLTEVRERQRDWSTFRNRLGIANKPAVVVQSSHLADERWTTDCDLTRPDVVK